MKRLRSGGLPPCGASSGGIGPFGIGHIRDHAEAPFIDPPLPVIRPVTRYSQANNSVPDASTSLVRAAVTATKPAAEPSGIKIGGWVRSEISWGVNGNSTTGSFASDYNNRYTNNFWSRERGYITADAREQTAYGVARGYIAVGIASQNQGNEVPSGQANMNRAFVQWAGFTAGLSVSFFDFYPAAALLYRAGNLPSEDSGDGGWWVWGYTAQLGGGFSATLSAEERRDNQNIDFSGAAGALGGMTTPGTNGAILGNRDNTAGYGGWQQPDIVGNLRVDQAWGSAQVMGALHEVNAGYYGALPASGHPGNAWGWVVGAGLKINTPFISPGDYFVGEVNYTEGATKYLWNATRDGNVYPSMADKRLMAWAATAFSAALSLLAMQPAAS